MALSDLKILSDCWRFAHTASSGGGTFLNISWRKKAVYKNSLKVESTTYKQGILH